MSFHNLYVLIFVDMIWNVIQIRIDGLTTSLLEMVTQISKLVKDKR